MKWTILGAFLRAATFVQHEPERAALHRLADEVIALDSVQAAGTSSR